MTMTVIGDFADPLSYLASQRVTRLRSLGIDVTWGAVTAQPRLPRATTPLTKAAVLITAAAALPGELLPATGTVVPNSGAASAAYAESLTESLTGSATGGLSVADHMRAALFDALWVQHRRIDDPEVIRGIVFDVFDAGYERANIRRTITDNQSILPHPVYTYPLAASRRSGYVVTLGGAPLTTDGQRRLDAWRQIWHDSGSPALPSLTTNRGEQLTGPDALHRLEQLVPRASTQIPQVPRQPKTVDTQAAPDRYRLGVR
jgi:2-hydroxychromene-2-carboxylate isomerase